MSSRRELLLFVLIAAAMLALSSLPDLSGYFGEDQQSAFGGTYFDAPDYSVHMEMLRAGMQGAWGYQLRFTSEPQQAAYTRLFYIGLGELNRLFRVAPTIVFQAARLVVGFAALLAIYLLAKRSFEADASRWRWLAFSMAVLGSGVGWVQRAMGWIPGPITPIDFWMIDPYVLFGLSLFPHFAFSIALMCLALALYVDFLAKGNWLRIGAVILAGVLIQFVNPIAFLGIDATIVVLTIVPGSTSVVKRSLRWAALLVIACSQIPLLVYNLQLVGQNPAWSQFALQNETLSPPPIYYLWGFGLLWPLAVVGAIQALRRRRIVLLATVAWAIVAFLMAYSPSTVQRRFLLGITIPLGFLATFGAMCVLESASKRSSWISRRVAGLSVLVGIFVCLNTLIFILAHTFYMLRRPPDYFYPRALNAGLEWIVAKTQPDDIILTTARTGQLVAQFTGRRVFVGHEMETLFYTTKVAEVDAFYRGDLAADWLSKYPICWIVYGPYEREIAPDFSNASNLFPVFGSASVQIYRNPLCP